MGEARGSQQVADKIARFFAGVIGKQPSQHRHMRAQNINGFSGFILADPEGALSTIAFDVAEGRIAAVYIVVNPENLQRVVF